MRFEPWIPKRAAKPFVFVMDANGSGIEIVDEKGGSKRFKNGTDALEKLANKVAIYSLVKPSQLILFGGAQNWKVIKYHERTQRMVFKDTTSIHAFSTFGPDPQELLPFFDALRDLDIGPASLSTMANNSWLRTLPRRYNFVEWGRGPKIGRLAFHGGRKESLQPLPATYSGVKYLDLSAAYLQAMRDPIPIQLSERREYSLPEEGICEATISVPRSTWNPVPLRLNRGKRGIDLQIYPHGKARGYFIVSELRNAIENHGVTAKVERVWKGYPLREPFENWLPWAFELRQLPGNSGLAAKHLTTRLWSLFARNPTKFDKVEISFEDAQGKRKVRRMIPGAASRALDGTVFISAIIASRVRVRLLEELIPAGAVHVDTDGGIVPDTAEVPGWRTDKRMSEVEIRSPQAYRYRCPDCPNCETDRHPTDSWHYKFAGIRVNDPMLPAIFEHTKPNQMIGRKYTAIAVPAQSMESAEQWIQDQEITEVADESL